MKKGVTELDEVKQRITQDQMLKFDLDVRLAHGEGLTYAESIVQVCARYGIDYEDVVKFISPRLMQDMTTEAIKLKQVKGSRSIAQFA